MPALPFSDHAAHPGLLGKPGRPASIALAIISGIAIGMPSLIVGSSLGQPAAINRTTAALPVVPPQQMPPVDPVNLIDLTPDDARAINATVPYSTGPNPAARPFRLGDASIAAARAVDCLATAVLYEAGDDTTGQRAVAQVIINRVRHPAFPKTICGVVFQGAERRTGCQFTFTCDGALIRHRWSDEAWMRARAVATAALNGRVFAKVGHATHYHTDWVVPYWSSSLDKVSAVGTHLFFRWTGWWGTPPAFFRRVDVNEPAITQLAVYSPAHRAGMDLLTLAAAGELPAEPYIAPNPVPGDPNAFLATIDRRANPDDFRKLAEASCGTRSYCKYMAWTARFNTPAVLPLGPFQVATMSFSYLRDRARGFEKALWSCGQFPRADRRQCMKAQPFVPDAPGTPATPSTVTTATAEDKGPAGPPFTRAVSENAKLAAALDAPASSPRTKPRVSGSLQPSTPARPSANPALPAAQTTTPPAL